MGFGRTVIGIMYVGAITLIIDHYRHHSNNEGPKD